MSSDESKEERNAVMSSRQAAELDFAFERNGWEPKDVKKLSQGDMLATILPVVRGQAKVVSAHTINCDADPFVPNGWTVEEHRPGGKLEWNPAKIQLYLSKKQEDGLVGNKLRKELANQPVLNACVLDYLLAHQELIPDEWKGQFVCFWGTIYRHSGGSLVVRYLCWRGGGWGWDYGWLDSDFDGDYPAVVSASN